MKLIPAFMGIFLSFLAIIGGILGLVAYDRAEKLEEKVEVLEEKLNPSAKNNKERTTRKKKDSETPRIQSTKKPPRKPKNRSIKKEKGL